MTLKNPLGQLTTNSVVYGVSLLLQRLVGLLLLPFFTSVLNTSDYGVLSIISILSVLLIGILNLGTNNSISILYFEEVETSLRSGVIWSAIFTLIINCLIIVSVLWIVTPYICNFIFESEHYNTLIRLAFLNLFITVVTEPFLLYLKMNNRANFFVLLNISIFCVVTSLSIWLILYQQVGVIGIIVSQCIGSSLLLILLFITVAKELTFFFEKRLMFLLVKIGFPSIIGSFATLLLVSTDRWFIKYFLGLDQLGIYSLGLSMGMVMSLIMGAFDTAWSPFFTSYINKREEAKKLFGKVFLYYVLFMGMITLLFFAFAKPLVIFLLSSPFLDAYLVIGLVAASQAIYGAYLILGAGLFLEKKLLYLSAFKWIAAFINIGFCLILTPKYGISGTAFSMLIGYVSLLPMCFYASNRELRVKYRWEKIFPFIFVLIIFCSALWYSSSFLPIHLVLVLGFLFAVSLFLFILFISLTLDEREFLFLNLKSVIQKN